MLNKFTLILFCLSFSDVLAQQLLKGKVVAENSAAEGVLVVNLTTEKETKTNPQGDFTIMAKPGDLLILFSYELYKKRIVLDETDFEKPLEIVMEANPNQLEEVVVERYRINPEDLGLVPKGQKVYTPGERKALRGNGDALIVERKDKLRAKFESYFKDTMIIQNLGIPKEYVEGYKYFIIENPEFVQAMNANNRMTINRCVLNLAEKYKKMLADE